MRKTRIDEEDETENNSELSEDGEETVLRTIMILITMMMSVKT